MTLKKVVGLLAVTLVVASVSGCGFSLVGKRRVDVDSDRDGWQISVLNGRGFDQHEGGYLFAFYDASLPNNEGFSLLQLWSGVKKQKAD